MGGRTVAAGSVVTNPLAKMCPIVGTHDSHIWTDDSEWFCFGGPFIEMQEEIKRKRYLEDEP